MTLNRRSLSALLVMLALATICSAQTAMGILSGTVTDPSGGVLKDVFVEATDPEKRIVVATANTDASGFYTLMAPAGSYIVHMHLAGFSDRQSDWKATSAAATTENVSLGLSPLSDRTTVVATDIPAKSEISTKSSALPTSVTVIDQNELARTNVERDVANMFRRVPGVMPHNLDQGDTGNAIHMRGFLSSTHGADTAVYIDGIAQNVPSSAINHGMDDMSWLTPDMIERIEVIKGPFSALYGDQNRSGAINIITRSKARNSVGVTLGRFGNLRTSDVLSGERGRFQGLIVADLFKNTGYRKNADQTRGNLFAKGSMIRGSSIWALRIDHQRSDWNAAGFLNLNNILNGSVQPVDRDPTVPPLWGKAKRSSVVFTRNPRQEEGGLQLSASVENYARTRALGANLTDLNVQDDARWIFQARVVENLISRKWAAVSFGGEFRRDVGDAINRRWVSNVPSANYTFDQDLNLNAAGIFAQGQLKPFRTLKLLGGIRLDGFDYDIKNRKLPTASLKYTQTVVTPRGGVVWTPVKAVDLSANIGQGFRSPNQTEISPSGNLGPLGASGGTTYPNLKPPKVKSYDFGASTSTSDRWRVSLSRYHTLNTNEILQTAPGVFDAISNTTRDGWELESKFDPAEKLSLYSSYGRITKARINNPLPNTAYLLSVPRDAIKMGAAYTTPFRAGSLLLNADIFYISGIPYFTGTPLGLLYAKRYTRYDLRATYDIHRAQFTTFATLQPNSHISEVAVGSAAGLTYDPRPWVEVGVSARYRF